MPKRKKAFTNSARTGGFGGYFGATADANFFIQPAKKVNSGDAEVNHMLTRLSKKDPRTKLKALAELTEAFQKKTTHELEIIAPSWVHSLTALSLDNERKIREAAHVAHREFVAKIGSGLAVYMKRIFTHWYLHMHDNSPAVVAAATKSWATAFPSEKRRKKALAYCQKEFLKEVTALLKQNADALSPKTATPDERNECFERVMSASLLALGDTIRRNKKPTVELFGEALNAALKHVKSKRPPIRAAAYQFVQSVFSKDSELAHSNKESMITNLQSNVSKEKVASNFTSFWNAVLKVITCYPDSWEIFNMPKLCKSVSAHLMNTQEFKCVVDVFVTLPNETMLTLQPSELSKLMVSFWRGITKIQGNRHASTKAVEQYFRLLGNFLSRNHPEISRELVKNNLHALININWTDEDCPRAFFLQVCKFMVNLHSSEPVLPDVTSKFCESLKTIEDEDDISDLVGRGKDFYKGLLDLSLEQNFMKELLDSLQMVFNVSLEMIKSGIASTPILKFLLYLTRSLNFESVGLDPSFCSEVITLTRYELEEKSCNNVYLSSLFSLIDWFVGTKGARAVESELCPFLTSWRHWSLFVKNLLCANSLFFEEGILKEIAEKNWKMFLETGTIRESDVEHIESMFKNLLKCKLLPVEIKQTYLSSANNYLDHWWNNIDDSMTSEISKVNIVLSICPPLINQLPAEAVAELYEKLFWFACQQDSEEEITTNIDVVWNEVKSAKKLEPMRRKLCTSLEDELENGDDTEFWVTGVSKLIEAGGDPQAYLDIILSTDVFADLCANEISRMKHFQESIVGLIEAFEGIQEIFVERNRVSTLLSLLGADERLEWSTDDDYVPISTTIFDFFYRTRESHSGEDEFEIPSKFITDCMTCCLKSLSGKIDEKGNSRVFGFFCDVLVHRKTYNIEHNTDLQLHELVETLTDDLDDVRNLQLLEVLLHVSQEFDPDLFNQFMDMILNSILETTELDEHLGQLLDVFCVQMRTMASLGALQDESYAEAVIPKLFEILDELKKLTPTENTLHVIASRNHFASSLLSILPPPPQTKREHENFLSMYALQEEDSVVLYQWAMLGIEILSSSTMEKIELWKSPSRIDFLFYSLDLLTHLTKLPYPTDPIVSSLCISLLNPKFAPLLCLRGGASPYVLARADEGHQLLDMSFQVIERTAITSIDTSDDFLGIVLQCFQSQEHQICGAAYQLATRLLCNRASKISQTYVAEKELAEEDVHVSGSISVDPVACIPQLLQILLFSCPSEKDPDFFYRCRAFFLSWWLLLDISSVISQDVKFEISEFLKKQDNWSKGFNAVMLEAVEHMDMSKTSYGESQIVGSDIMEMLILEAKTNPFPEQRLRRFKVLQQHDREDARAFLPLMASRIFYKCLCGYPALCRNWWKHVPRHVNVVTTKLAKHAFSPIILNHHLTDQSVSFEPLDDFSVSFLKPTLEVRAEYRQDEVSLGVILTYPTNYPLEHIKAHFSHTVGVEKAKSRRWLLTIQRMVNAENSSVSDALLCWRKNVQKHFEGVEDCPICYSVVHTQTKCLPTFPCPTCNGTFHRACIRKWVKTSGKTSCPLCRGTI